MKKTIFFFTKLALQVILTASLSGLAYAERMDIATHTVLIDKLKSVVDLSEEGVSKQNMIQRLADLNAERARLYAMEDEGKGDIKFKKEIAADRKNALSLYAKALKTANTETKAKILLQMAQLNHLMGNAKKSQSLYADIIKNQKRYEKSLVAQAYTEVGEYEFSRQKFTEARKNYEKALGFKEAPRRGYIQYRLAWCEFQLGFVRDATKKMITLLSTPHLFKRTDGTTDIALQEEASRDLSTFLARKDVSQKDIKTLADLSPTNTKDANLTYLATELDRTGKKNSALMVWAVLGTHKRSDDDKLEGQIKIARIQYDLNKKTQAIAEIGTAAKMLKKNRCTDRSKCDNYQQQLRKIVTDWGLAEERQPSAQLISAYKTYLTEFPDLEMNYWAGIASQKRKQWVDSFGFYKKASEMAYEVIHDPSMKSSVKNISSLFEGALLGTIEAAEQSKQLNLKNDAYAQYLRLNPNGAKSLEVEYQIAQLLLDKGENAKAAQKFREVALSTKAGQRNLKDKSADLALDTLVILKDDENIEKWAYDFANHFKSRQIEFLVLARKSVINQAAKVINTSKSNSDLEKQSKKLSAVNLLGASPQERVSLYKHRLLLANKLKSIPDIIIITTALLKEKSLSAADIRETKNQLAWAYEMKLDFKNALATLKTIEPQKRELADHTLKLGVFSELAGLSPVSHYEKFLSLSKDRSKKQEVALSLVRVSKNKTAAFNKYKSHLVSNAKMYITAGLYAYDEKKTDSLKRDLLKRGPRTSFEVLLLSRAEAITDIQNAANQIGRHKLSQNLNRLKSSIDERLKLIAKLEKLTSQAINKKDFSLQFISLNYISAENARLAQDILRLPQPKGLNKETRKQYQALLEEQVAPYNEKSRAAKKAVDDLWSKRNGSNFNDVFELANQSSLPGSKLALEEVYSVTRAAKRFGYSQKDLALKQPQRQKLSQELKGLKLKVQKNPFEINNLEKIKEIESRLGGGPIVAYLDARVSKLKTGGLN